MIHEQIVKNWVYEYACLPMELTKAVLYNFIWKEILVKGTSKLQVVCKIDQKRLCDNFLDVIWNTKLWSKNILNQFQLMQIPQRNTKFKVKIFL